MSNPFEKLAALRDQLPPGPAPKPAAPARDPVEAALRSKVVVRHERKGRGGKTVTMVQGLALQPAALEAFSRELKKALGCGATVEDGAIVLQGELMDRVIPWLEQRGATKLVRGST